MVLGTKLNTQNQVMLHIKIMKCHILALRMGTQMWLPKCSGASKTRSNFLTPCQNDSISRPIKDGTTFERGGTEISTFTNQQLFCPYNFYFLMLFWKWLSESYSQNSNILNTVFQWYPHLRIWSQFELTPGMLVWIQSYRRVDTPTKNKEHTWKVWPIRGIYCNTIGPLYP